MRNLSMLTDFYQFTMSNGYFEQGDYDRNAVFDLFFRDNEINRYAIAAGLEQAIDYINNLRFDNDDIKYLKGLGEFSDSFLNYLAEFKFSGDIYAVEEGTVVFPGEPILTVKAPIIEAQIVETALLTLINHQTLIASKASRIRHSCKDDILMEFGLRRAQGADAGIFGSRAAIIGGCNSTSNVYAAKEFSIPPKGTHSHSWVMSFEDEITAFREYARLFPNNCMLLVDTFDTINSGVKNAIIVFNELRAKGFEGTGIRLDSGDLSYLSKKARIMLDEAGFPNVKICASGDLDEYLIQSLKAQGAKIDIWGVGTKLITSEDMPSLGGVYKMAAVEQNGVLVPKIKVSNNIKKMTNPCFKTLYRIYDKLSNMAIADLICLHDEVIDDSKPLSIFHPVETWKQMEITNFYVKKLHKPIFIGGKQVYNCKSLTEIAELTKCELETFWEEYKRSEYPQVFKVDLSKALYDIKADILSRLTQAKK